MTERTVNIPLLRKAVEWAEAEAAKPWELSEWYQASFVSSPSQVGIMEGRQKSPECGTCYCIAGYIVRTQGLSNEDGWVEPAAKALGISDSEDAWRLFEANNEIEDVRRIAEDIAGERL